MLRFNQENFRQVVRTKIVDPRLKIRQETMQQQAKEINDSGIVVDIIHHKQGKPISVTSSKVIRDADEPKVVQPNEKFPKDPRKPKDQFHFRREKLPEVKPVVSVPCAKNLSQQRFDEKYPGTGSTR